MQLKQRRNIRCSSKSLDLQRCVQRLMIRRCGEIRRRARCFQREASQGFAGCFVIARTHSDSDGRHSRNVSFVTWHRWFAERAPIVYSQTKTRRSGCGEPLIFTLLRTFRWVMGSMIVEKVFDHRSTVQVFRLRVRADRLSQTSRLMFPMLVGTGATD